MSLDTTPLGFTTPDKLFELATIDPNPDKISKTSVYFSEGYAISIGRGDPTKHHYIVVRDGLLELLLPDLEIMTSFQASEVERLNSSLMGLSIQPKKKLFSSLGKFSY